MIKLETEKSKFIARPNQLLMDHLIEVGKIAKCFAAKIGLGKCGELIGLLHDIGKYSQEFQNYINSIAGNLNPDVDDDYVDTADRKGKIDHSTAGARQVWCELKKYGQAGQGLLCGQILALCIASHHSGLIDCLDPKHGSVFKKRMAKEISKESVYFEDSVISDTVKNYLNKNLVALMWKKLQEIAQTEQHGQQVSCEVKYFYFGMLTKFLFSCLIDADRINSANPDKKHEKTVVPWDIAIVRLERALNKIPIKAPIDHIRKQISDYCYAKAQDMQGIYTLEVPTGGGKTYASLRYALHHAKQHNLEHIIYIIPYTSIIEQNAAAVRELIENKADVVSWVLEHHSNLEPEMQTWHSKLTSENWDAPIIFITMVQFLEALFGSGTRGVRHLHQLSRSVLIFDEIQTLPIKCIHIFCNALNFFVKHANTTAILCTATQPLLNDQRLSGKGQLDIPADNKLVQNLDKLFDDLQRVDIVNKCRVSGWTMQEITDFAVKEFQENERCLIIVNTKEWARKLYLNLKQGGFEESALFHLSTNQCAKHRKEFFEQIKGRLSAKLPVLCISTQLVEAGVDIDFPVVMRFLAGLDSIAQAAGRCNRNGELKDEYGNFIRGKVYVLNPDDEKIDSLCDIKIGKEICERIFREHSNGGLLYPETIKQYFKYYFFDRTGGMSYKVNSSDVGCDTTLLDLLSCNSNNVYQLCGNNERLMLRQSFKTAGKIFRAIDAPTQAVIVPYGKEGKKLITELCMVAKEFNQKTYYELLRKAQRYSVNVFPNIWQKLKNEKAIYEIQEEGVFYLDERYYSKEFGLSIESVAMMSNNIC